MAKRPNVCIFMADNETILYFLVKIYLAHKCHAQNTVLHTFGSD